jgi:hypothetical protein
MAENEFGQAPSGAKSKQLRLQIARLGNLFDETDLEIKQDSTSRLSQTQSGNREPRQTSERVLTRRRKDAKFFSSPRCVPRPWKTITASKFML